MKARFLIEVTDDTAGTTLEALYKEVYDMLDDGTFTTVRIVNHTRIVGKPKDDSVEEGLS